MRYASFSLVPCLVAATVCSAQSWQRIDVRLDDSGTPTIGAQLRNPPNDFDLFQRQLCDEALQKRLPAWDFQLGEGYPQMTILLQRVGGPSLSNLGLSVNLEFKRGLGDFGETIGPMILFKPSELASCFHNSTSFRREFLTRFQQHLNAHGDDCLTKVRKLPVANGFLTCPGPLEAVLPIPWDEFRDWSKSWFGTDFDVPARVNILSQASGSDCPVPQRDQTFVEVEHREVGPTADNRQPVNGQNSYQQFLKGSVRLETLEWNYEIPSNRNLAPRPPANR